MTDKPPPYPEQQPPGVYPQPGYGAQQPGYPPQHVQPGYPPPQPGFPPQQAGYPAQPTAYAAAQPGYSTTTTIIQQPQIHHLSTNIRFHESPVATTCPACRANIVSATSYVTGTLTWLACLGLCVIGCDAGCCLIPFCVDSMKDVVHSCPACGSQIGVYRRM